MLISDSAALAPDGAPFIINTLKNQAGMQVEVMDWGATWLSCQLPLGNGERREVLLGCPNPQDYPQQGAYLGASVGRYANRIANAHLTHDGQHYALVANQDQHQLHGGPQGFHARRWEIIQQDQQQVVYQLHSAAGDQGFLGNLLAQASYRLTEDNRLEIQYQASVDSPCPVSMTNHAYFNLDSEGTDARQQRLQLFADHYLPVASDGIPSAGLTSVARGGMDFRQPKAIAAEFLAGEDQQLVQGYDHGYLLQTICTGGLHPAAHLWSADGRVQMTVFTDAPALQFYSGNFLAGTPARRGGNYPSYAGIALESEFLPDSPNHPEWPQPDCWLLPGQRYRSTTSYQFIAL